MSDTTLNAFLRANQLKVVKVPAGEGNSPEYYVRCQDVGQAADLRGKLDGIQIPNSGGYKEADPAVFVTGEFEKLESMLDDGRLIKTEPVQSRVERIGGTTWGFGPGH